MHSYIITEIGVGAVSACSCCAPTGVSDHHHDSDCTAQKKNQTANLKEQQFNDCRSDMSFSLIFNTECILLLLH